MMSLKVKFFNVPLFSSLICNIILLNSLPCLKCGYISRISLVSFCKVRGFFAGDDGVEVAVAPAEVDAGAYNMVQTDQTQIVVRPHKLF